MSAAPQVDVRAELARLMRATVEDRGFWRYEAVRPLPVPATWRPSQWVRADCSHGVKLLARWAGGPDPMQAGFQEFGNSQTICVALRHLRLAQELLVGDVVTFGVSGQAHAAMVLERGLDPLLWSFGHQGAPNTYRLSRDRRPAQFLRLPVPPHVPTPEEVLRAREGWFAWMSWGLAEGDWRGYGRFDPAVRPDVPTRIPAVWWARRVRFLLHRGKAA